MELSRPLREYFPAVVAFLPIVALLFPDAIQEIVPALYLTAGFLFLWSAY